MENYIPTEIENNLVDIYQKTYPEIDQHLRDNKNNNKYWCVINKQTDEPIKPSIPFVGRKYAEVLNSSDTKCYPKILIYGSAENLSEYDSGNTNDEAKADVKQDEIFSWNRHRISYEKIGGEFFPYVHIQPVTDGGLMCAALLVNFAMRGIWYSDDPKEFLETLVVANAGKFSRSGSNKDYAGSSKYMKPSLEFIKKDLELLKPKVVIIPRTIYKTICKDKGIEGLFNDKIVVQIYQISHWNMKHLEKYKSEAEILEKKFGNDVLGQWTEKIANRRIDYYCFYCHIIKSLKEVGIDTGNLCD